MSKSATRGWSSTRSGAPEPPEERRHRRAEPDHAHHDELAEGLEEAALRGHGRRAAEHESGQAVLGHLVAGPELRVRLARREGVAGERALEGRHVTLEVLRIAHERGLHEAASAEQPDRV